MSHVFPILKNKEDKIMVVYVTTQGARIIREGRHLIVRKENDIYHTLFIYKLEQLVIMGNVTITPPALKLLLRENIDTVFLRMDGRYQGRLAQAEPKNVFLRKRQFALADDEQFCISVARSIVRGKLLNMAAVAQRIQRTRKEAQAGRIVSEIRRMTGRIDESQSLDTLRGIEGQATASYFAAFRLGLDADFGFSRRVRRPPTDPVNSVLSLLYTFLINRAYAAVRIAGLDPYPGVLHSLEYGRHSLPLDLVEEFRTILADTLTLALFNLGVLKSDDFYTVTPPAQQTVLDDGEKLIDIACQESIGQMGIVEEEDVFDLPEQQLGNMDCNEEIHDGKAAVRLYPLAFARVIKAFEKKITTEFYHSVAEKRMTYGEAMIFQARLFRRVIEGDAAHYQPLLLK
jgi:CRISPR-associated protein Cas1